MKITHNKVGQNLNLVDGVKSNKAQDARGVKNGPSAIADSLESAGAAKVDVSDRAQEASRIKEIAMASTPDVDMAKVEKFRKLIDAGQYKVDAQAVADRMVDEQLKSEF